MTKYGWNIPTKIRILYSYDIPDKDRKKWHLCLILQITYHWPLFSVGDVPMVFSGKEEENVIFCKLNLYIWAEI
jgi:hypothetical protein